jgi:DNA-binding GntR family transcriptional regulator
MPSALPPYQRIAAKIRARIDSGDLQPGDHIPSVRDIVRDEGVSTATATRVAAVLRADGVAHTVTGIGTVVAPRRTLTTGPDRLNMLRIGGTGFRSSEHVEILSADLAPAPDDVADALGIDPGDQAVRRQRIYRDDEGVVALSTSWLPGELASSAPELISTDPLPTMTFGLVEERTGRRAVKRRDVVSLRSVPDDASTLLGVDADVPILVMVNHYWDQRGEPTEYAVDYLGPGRQLVAEHRLD